MFWSDHLTAKAWRKTSGFVRLLLAISIALGLTAGTIWHWVAQPLPMPGDRIQVHIEPGTHARGVARALKRAGLEVNEAVFIATVRAMHAAQSLHAGRYEFTQGVSVRDIIEKLRRGEVMAERFTIVEGWSLRDIRRAIAQNPQLGLEGAAFTDASVVQALGSPYASAEGLLAPDTYVFAPGTHIMGLFKQAHETQMERLQDAWKRRAPGLPYQTPYEALIMASIVEKETGQGSERAMVAGVFVNRLRLGMRLQTDPTVIYGLGERFDGNLRKIDLQTDGPYNSYTRAGLPPTPIAMPGKDSLWAALNPASTRALYFVARGDGTTHFSESLTEHTRAVQRHQLKRKP